ncbi:Os03g0425033 [Oryza sativa Japonica Group]|uniref:Os03g0425033 protein n=1 Tax=Oryza sativa subsp. japonica TaxID=39947 RepID=C7J0D4_ORYSJ|nr:Os03g0425033 [Oryza sativa Japonica Group]|eukprot:NP_001173479.1 Os03g0425033 [Oryza sativa Japonica Group]
MLETPCGEHSGRATIASPTSMDMSLLRAKPSRCVCSMDTASMFLAMRWSAVAMLSGVSGDGLRPLATAATTSAVSASTSSAVRASTMDLLRDTSWLRLDGAAGEKAESVWMNCSLFLWRFSSNMPSANCATLSSRSSSSPPPARRASRSSSASSSSSSSSSVSRGGLGSAAFFCFKFVFLDFFFLFFFLGEATIRWSEGERPRASMERRAERRARTHQSLVSAGRERSRDGEGDGDADAASGSEGRRTEESGFHCSPPVDCAECRSSG